MKKQHKKIYLNGHIDVPSERMSSVKTGLVEHIALTRSEEGCISFEVVESNEIDGRFLVSEVFVNKAAFDAHQTRTKASDWFKITEGIHREYSIRSEER